MCYIFYFCFGNSKSFSYFPVIQKFENLRGINYLSLDFTSVFIFISSSKKVIKFHFLGSEQLSFHNILWRDRRTGANTIRYARENSCERGRNSPRSDGRSWFQVRSVCNWSDEPHWYNWPRTEKTWTFRSRIIFSSASAWGKKLLLLIVLSKIHIIVNQLSSFYFFELSHILYRPAVSRILSKPGLKFKFQMIIIFTWKQKSLKIWKVVFQSKYFFVQGTAITFQPIPLLQVWSLYVWGLLIFLHPFDDWDLLKKIMDLFREGQGEYSRC